MPYHWVIFYFIAYRARLVVFFLIFGYSMELLSYQNGFTKYD